MENRISILDSFRVLACLMVIAFHYYSYYPLKGFITYHGLNLNLFKHGYLGVKFFFIISGFVITLSLQKSIGILDFLKKRWVRLWPAMVFCSIFTFVIISIFDNENLFIESTKISNLIFSNTFLSTSLASSITGHNFNYIDGTYWSLWVEVCFYVLVAVIYFLDKKNVNRNFGIIAVFMAIFSYLIFSSNNQSITTLIGVATFKYVKISLEVFNIFQHILWFFLGMQLLEMYKFKRSKNLIIFTVAFSLQTILQGSEWQILLFCVIMYILFLIFIYRPVYISLLGSRYAVKLGIATYSVYLLHENIGVLIINKFSFYFKNLNWLIGILLIGLFFFFGILIYRYVEQPIGQKLRRYLIKN